MTLFADIQIYVITGDLSISPAFSPLILIAHCVRRCFSSPICRILRVFALSAAEDIHIYIYIYIYIPHAIFEPGSSAYRAEPRGERLLLQLLIYVLFSHVIVSYSYSVSTR